MGVGDGLGVGVGVGFGVGVGVGVGVGFTTTGGGDVVFATTAGVEPSSEVDMTDSLETM